ncbi:MAG: CHAT domain-containing protein [Terracidiphilus sp.]|jgi:CHAT domain-containing protein/tetratricopeptide (TPR) repeat protein
MLTIRHVLSTGRIKRIRICASLVAGWLSLAPIPHAQPTAKASPVRPASADQSAIFTRIVPDDCHAASDSNLSELKSAVTGFRNHGDHRNELRALILLGELYEQTGEYKQALPFLQSALELVRDSGERSQVLTMTADALTQVGKPDAALRDATEALNISTKLGNVAAEASALRAQAEAVYSSSAEKAMPYLLKALPLSEHANDLKTKAMILNDEGAATQDAGSPFDIFHQALSIEDQIHDCRDKIDTLTNLATLEFNRGQIRNALADFDDAVALEHQVGDHTSEAETLHQLGYFHWELGDLGESLSDFNQALQLKHHAGDVASEADTLGAIAGVYRDTQWPTAALRAYLRVLPLFQRTNNVPWQVIVLNNLGTVEADLHQKTQARTYYNRSIQLAPKANDPVTPAYSAWGIGELEQADALPSYFQSARLAREYEQADLEGEVDSSLMDHFRSHHQPNVAIFFGKRAVDRFQLLRKSMGGMSNALTSSFLQRKSATYRELAETLIDQGRLVEAQQVLDLLKIQQYSDYVGEQPSELSQPLVRSAREVPLQDEFERQLAEWVSKDKALHAAESADHRQPAAILQARAVLLTAEANFNAFLQNLYKQLEAQDGPAIAVQSVTGTELPLERLLDKDTDAVALYTLEGTDRYRVIVISHAGRFARSYPVAQNALDEKCRQFLDLVKGRDPGSSASADELYEILIAPIQKDLEALHAKTLVWCLDGSLRYIPIDALFNSETKRYLVDDYRVVNFTPLSQSIENPPAMKAARAIAMGISRKYFNDLGALLNVKDELNSVVTDPNVPDSHGPVSGTILMNEQFTEKALEEGLKSQDVVHIASHFVLRPGNDDLSFLLLGGKDQDHSGYKYSMADFEKSRDVQIQGTKLLTLSACQTGAANERDICFQNDQSSVKTAECQAGNAKQRENGVVMESMSEVVLEKGVEAALSSLWSVDDMSTSALMADFYQRWAGSDGAVSKAEALRQAELDLLHGNAMPQPGAGGRGVHAVENGPAKQAAPAGLALPYYWAPFVLTGNWQ